MGDDSPCTDCASTGITIQTERRCSCGAQSDWFAGDVDSDGNELVTLPRDELQRQIASAFEAGCHAVHANYQEDRDPSFSEAASDYARGLDL